MGLDFYAASDESVICLRGFRRWGERGYHPFRLRAPLKLTTVSVQASNLRPLRHGQDDGPRPGMCVCVPIFSWLDLRPLHNEAGGPEEDHRAESFLQALLPDVSAADRSSIDEQAAVALCTSSPCARPLATRFAVAGKNNPGGKCPDMALACFLGCWYTVFCWKPDGGAAVVISATKHMER